MAVLALTNVLFLVGVGFLVCSLAEPLPTRPFRVLGWFTLLFAFFLMVAVTTMVI